MFGKLKLNLWTLIGFQEINTSWIDLKFLLHKLEKRVQIFQQVLLNLNIGCKSYSILNWSWNYVKTLLVSLGNEGLNNLLKASNFL